MSLHTCTAPDCGRSFLDPARLLDHADAVHTFDDIRGMVAEAVRESFTPPAPAGGGGMGGMEMDRCYVWLQDLADDWCVFQVESAGDCKLLKVGYTIVNGDVNFAGDPVEVTRRTVYDPVSAADANDGAAKTKAAPSDAEMMAAEKALTAAELATYKSMRAKGMTHAMAMGAAKKAKA